MKKNFLILVYCFFLQMFVHAADKYWVGPQAGNWADNINWSFTPGGVGGAGRPVLTDAVIFSGNALVNLNVSVNIYSLRTSFGTNKVTLYTSTGSTLTILNSLRVEPASTLKDSTSANVAFNVVFSGANHAIGTIYGDWIFEGGVSLSGSSNGARFTAEDGSLVTVAAPQITPNNGGRIIFKKNTGTISSTAATLKFSYASFFVLDNNLNAAIPAATWAKDSLRTPAYSGFLGAPASTIQITGNIGQLKFLDGIPTYGTVVLDLYALAADASLALPDGSKIRGNLSIVNTNSYTLTLLAGTSATSRVQVELGTTEAGNLFGGYLNISGATTKVALAKATATAPATSYKLLVNKSYSQTGGNFSLQDYDNATGSSILDIKGDLVQTGGTFITNSTSTSASAKFIVVMDDSNVITGPSGGFASVKYINMTGGTIDNARHMVTLRIDHSIYSFPGSPDLPNGVLLQSPLEVGKLELIRAPLTTSATNILTVSNPGINAITVGTTGKSYVNGPLRRVTNSNQFYFFPTGKGNSTLTAYMFDSCGVVPASNMASVYQAEYFKAAYASLDVSAPLKEIDHSEYWDITKISGSDAQVALTLNAALSGAAATDGIVVAHYIGGHWISEHGSVLTPGNAASGTVLSKPLSAFSPFTFGYVNPADLTPVTVGGLSYKFYQGSYSTLPDFNAMTPVKTGTSANVDISVRPAGTDDGFAFIWQGYINIPASGNYTFETISDDGSKLYFNTPYNVNATALVDNDGTHAAQSVTGTVNIAAAGIYPITITFFENYGGESMQVYWSGPGIPRQPIPDAAFKALPQPGTGLKYKFYHGIFNTLPDFDALAPVQTGASSNVDISVRPAGINDGFAFVWQGYINIPASGNYTLETVSDDGSKLYFNTPYNFNASALVNNDGIHPAQSATGTVNVPSAGWYPVTITFFENYGGESMQVYWSGPGFARQQIPDAAFSSGAAPATGGLNYKYYEGDFDMLPDYTALTPVKTGTTNNVDIGVRTAGVNDHFAFIWDGYINLPSAGTYTFETISDDGSKVYINMPYSVNGNSTVNNDGLHAPQSATGTVTVAAAGKYPISVTFFEKDGGETMQLYWSGPGISRQPVPDAAFSTVNGASSTPAMYERQMAVKQSSLNEGSNATRVYPNPFAENFTIDYYCRESDNKKIRIELYDQNGKLIYRYQPSTLIAGNNRFHVNLTAAKLPAGIYTVQIKVNGVPATSTKLVKMKR